jgi:hypothetical protein
MNSGIRIKLSRIPINLAHLMTSVSVEVICETTKKKISEKGWKTHLFVLEPGNYTVKVIPYAVSITDIDLGVSKIVEVKDGNIQNLQYRHPISRSNALGEIK